MKTLGLPEEAQAREAHKPRRLLPAGQHRARIVELTEGISPKGSDTFRIVLSILDAEGNEHRPIDVASATTLGALKLIRLCRACQCEEAYNAGHLEPAMFIGKEVIATVQIEPKKKNFPQRVIITDYAPVASASVTPLHSVGKIASIIVSAALAASLPSISRANDLDSIKWWLYQRDGKCTQTDATPADAYRSLKNAKVQIAPLQDGVMYLVKGDDGTIALFDAQRACEAVKAKLQQAGK